MTALELSTPPDGVDRLLWLYELCRLLTHKLNTIIVAFFTDEPPCSAATCAEMRASEWQYLCAVHDPPKPCCAIDYSCHTLDWAANMLTSTKNFPSRLSLAVNENSSGGVGGTTSGTSNNAGQQQGLRNLTNICRRLYRIFAHAWYQHRAIFWQVESQTGLYVFFKTVCDVYQLIPEDNYTVPPEAEDLDSSSSSSSSSSSLNNPSGGGSSFTPPSVLIRKASSASSSSSSATQQLFRGSSGLQPSSSPSHDHPARPGSVNDRDRDQNHSGTATTRRHTTSLSIGSLTSSATSMTGAVVSTVPEEDEMGHGLASGVVERETKGKERDEDEELDRPMTRRTINHRDGQQPSLPATVTSEGHSKDQSSQIPPSSSSSSSSSSSQVEEVSQGNTKHNETSDLSTDDSSSAQNTATANEAKSDIHDEGIIEDVNDGRERGGGGGDDDHDNIKDGNEVGSVVDNNGDINVDVDVVGKEIERGSDEQEKNNPMGPMREDGVDNHHHHHHAHDDGQDVKGDKEEEEEEEVVVVEEEDGNHGVGQGSRPVEGGIERLV